MEFQMNRSRQTLLSIITLCISTLTAFAAPPNVIFFATDDLCDWVGPMDYDQAITPNIDKLGQRGVVFNNAHCPGTFCAPSRTAIFTGQFATTTGCYGTQVYFHNCPDLKPLQMNFQEGGYKTFGVGKLFHHPAGSIDLRGWDEFFVRTEEQKKTGWPMNSWGANKPKVRGNDTPVPEPYPSGVYQRTFDVKAHWFLEWGAIDNDKEEEMADTQRVNWACDVLKQKHDKPFFLAVGVYAPHFPNYAPQKYFDMYDRNKIKAPTYKDDDFEDLPPKVRDSRIARKTQHHDRLATIDRGVEDAIHGYLACVSYADAMLGQLMDALKDSPYYDNTVIVLWSDHGYHHGEKGNWGKHTLWERTTNVPFIWAGAGVEKGGSVDETASLIDMYPTFVDLCGLPEVDGLEGQSLAGTLQDSKTAQDRDVLVPGLKPNEYAIINQKWRYIHYADDSEELYNLKKDSNEWDNMAEQEGYEPIKEKLRNSAPKTFAPMGKPKEKMRLVTEGNTFRWEPKQGGFKNKKKK